jgi:hypothetical protein
MDFSSGQMKQYVDLIRIRDACFNDGEPVLPDQGNAELRELVSAATCRGFNGLLSVDPGTGATPSQFREAYAAFERMVEELF